MKHNEITIGVDYATGNYTKRRVRVVEVPSGNQYAGVAVNQQRVDDVAKTERRYGLPTIKSIEIGKNVGHVQHSSGYRATLSKGAYAVELDRETGKPRKHADGTLMIVFLHSREFKSTWADHVEAAARAEARAEREAKERREGQARTNAAHAAVLARLDALGFEVRGFDRDHYDRTKIKGMWLKDWNALLDVIDAKSDERWNVTHEDDGRTRIEHVDFPDWHWHRDKVEDGTPVANAADRIGGAS